MLAPVSDTETSSTPSIRRTAVSTFLAQAAQSMPPTRKRLWELACVIRHLSKTLFLAGRTLHPLVTRGARGKMTERAYSIGEASRQSGVKVPTIRFYEQSGLLSPPARSQNNRRVYLD